MKITCLSDLHGCQPELPGGDLLIIAGDCTSSDKLFDWKYFLTWLKEQAYKKKVLVGGNHDNVLMQCATTQEVRRIGLPDPGYDYLCDNGTEFEGLKIWGSPWTQTFPRQNPRCMAFALDTEEELNEKFKLIPEDTDILITHSPMYGVCDKMKRIKFSGRAKEEHTGSMSLRSHFFRVKPRLHVFGHIHEWGGKQLDLCTSVCVNAAYVNDYYEPRNEIVNIEI